MHFCNKTSLVNYPKTKGDPIHVVNVPLLGMFKPKLANGQEYFRWTSTITRVTELESQCFILFWKAGSRTSFLTFNPVIYTLATPSVVHIPAASASPQDLLEINVQPTRISILTRPPRACTTEVRKH